MHEQFFIREAARLDHLRQDWTRNPALAGQEIIQRGLRTSDLLRGGIFGLK